MKRTRLDGTLLFYSCSPGPEVAETWDRDSLLTEVLCDCIDRFNVLRVFDLLAIDAYRRLIDWQRVRDSSQGCTSLFRRHGIRGKRADVVSNRDRQRTTNQTVARSICPCAVASSSIRMMAVGTLQSWATTSRCRNHRAVAVYRPSVEVTFARGAGRLDQKVRRRVGFGTSSTDRNGSKNVLTSSRSAPRQGRTGHGDSIGADARNR